MDVEVIDVEEGNMGQHAIEDEEDAEPNNHGEANTVGNSIAQDEDGEPHVGMEFDSLDAAKIFYDEYARRVGFTTHVGQYNRSKSDGKVAAREFLCARDVLKRRAGDSCDSMLRIELKSENKWIVTRFVKEHSHSTVSPSKVHYLRPRRHFAGAAKNMTENYQGVGVVPSGVMYVSMDGNRVSAETNRGSRSAPAESTRTIKNTGSGSCVARPASRKRTLGKDAQNLLDYFKKMQAENPGFYYAIQLDDDNRMANVFWADARSRSAYIHFGDAVTLDTMYRVNQYRVPFAPFTGVNHHGQTVLFGCALLLDESEATFVWLFKTFLAAMNDCAPASIITDGDKSIQAAVVQVFPDTRHCVNKWDVLREGQERLAHVCHAHPNLQVELYNCINMTETIEEFESSWDTILNKYDLRRNDWLQSLYNARAQWIPVYFRDSFFAAISPNQGFQSFFFDGYVNQQTTLPMFFRQYERALENSFEKEIEADFETVCTTPVLRTPSPMEKQAANFYTRKIFAKFQDELVDTFVYTANIIEGDGAISTYRVAKFEDDNKAYIVTLDGPEMRASCSCQMFEYSGILCRHILTVFTVTNVLTLPSHYILKRWTRNAKSGVGSDEHVELQVPESLTLRYNNLCREAIKYAEEGAIAPETFNVAMIALREGGKKVAVAKKNVAKVAPLSSQVGGLGYDDRRTSNLSPDMTPLLWPREDETTRRFNLNDATFPAQPLADLNLPRMAPVSLHRDDGHSDNMVGGFFLLIFCCSTYSWILVLGNTNLFVFLVLCRPFFLVSSL